MKTRDESLTVKTAKLFAAASWLDEARDPRRLGAMKELMSLMRDMNSKEWARVEIYLDSPVEEEERQALLSDLVDSVDDENEKKAVLRELENLFRMDGSLSGEKREFLEEVKNALVRKKKRFFNPFKDMFHNISKKKRVSALRRDFRERVFEEFNSNRVLYDFKRHGKMKDAPEKRRVEISCAAAIMGRVALADGAFSPQEKEAMIQTLASRWNLPTERAREIADLAEERSGQINNFTHIFRGFRDCAEPETKKAFIADLFKLANASDKTCFEEIEEIRLVAAAIDVNHDDFAAALKTVPESDRVGMRRKPQTSQSAT